MSLITATFEEVIGKLVVFSSQELEPTDDMFVFDLSETENAIQIDGASVIGTQIKARFSLNLTHLFGLENCSQNNQNGTNDRLWAKVDFILDESEVPAGLWTQLLEFAIAAEPFMSRGRLDLTGEKYKSATAEEKTGAYIRTIVASSGAIAFQIEDIVAIQINGNDSIRATLGESLCLEIEGAQLPSNLGNSSNTRKAKMFSLAGMVVKSTKPASVPPAAPKTEAVKPAAPASPAPKTNSILNSLASRKK